MKIVKKGFAVLSILLCMALMLTACGQSNKPADSTTAGSSATTTVAATTGTTTPAEKVPIKFYGQIKEFPDGDAMIQKMQELLPNYDIQPIQVDWGNLDKVVSVGIASGDPCDVYAFWPTMMQKYVDANQALDLTPYLDANNGEWRNQMTEGSLKMGTFNGKVYNVSYEISFDCFFVNVDAFTKAGLTVNPRWTWDEFMTDMKALKEKAGIATPFSVFNDAVKGLFSKIFEDEIESAGKKADAVAGNYPLTGPDAVKALTAVKTLFNSGLWYGGKGGLNISRDEAKAAFVQSKTAVLCEGAAVYASLAKDCSFKIEPVLYPTMKTDPTQVEAGGYGDGLFVPSNSAHPKEAAECVKVFTGKEVQKIHADSGFVVCNTNTQPSDPTVLKLVDLTQKIGDGKTYQSIAGQKFYDYTNKVLLPSVLLNSSSIDKALAGLDEVRTQALKDAESNK